MQSMQRRFGKLLPRSADEAQVAVLLSEFEDADKMLAKLIDAAKAWRDAWRDILNIQQRLSFEFHAMYQPIVGATDSFAGIHEPVYTPEGMLERVARLQEDYAGLRNDLLDEVNLVEDRIIKPATEGREYINPMKKVIRKRQDRKLDYERYQGRFDAAQKKAARSDRDNIALAKHESDLAIAMEEYHIADDKLKASLPPIITATFSLLPHLLAAQIMIQNTLLGQYYTQLHNYCQDQNFPSPPPTMTDTIATWEDDFRPAQHDIETNISFVARGKAIRLPMKQEDQRGGSSVTGLGLRNNTYRRATNQGSSALDPRRPSPSPSRSEHSEYLEIEPPSPTPPSPNYDTRPTPNMETRPRISSAPSTTALALSTPNYGSSNSSPGSDYLSPQTIHAPAGPRSDYFTRDRVPSGGMTLSTIAATKKKPPPPPPKRVPSNQGFWVTAVYDFAGQGQGDLVFKEGDRIRVMKKTDSTDDWWQGELRGVQGSFPANYCRP